MELHFSRLLAKKFWNYLRIAIFMLRKGLISKTKLFMDLNLKLQRGKLAGKTLANFMFHHHHHHGHQAPVSSRPLGFYEFSCSNTPNPIVSAPKRKCFHFSCIHATSTTDELCRPPGPVVAELFQQLSALSAGERCTPPRSPFSAIASSYSAEEEVSELGSVDVDVEEFIKKFYEQLKVQSPIALLQSPDMIFGFTQRRLIC